MITGSWCVQSRIGRSAVCVEESGNTCMLCSLGSCGTGLIIYIVAALVIPEDDTVIG